MKKQIPFHEYSWNIDGFNNYYPSYITKDANGLYGICSPFLGVEKSGIVSGKEIFDKIGIPEFDLCEWQEDIVLEKLRKSIEWDLLNEAYDFGSESWAEEAEKKFIEELVPKLYGDLNDNPLYNCENVDIRKQLFDESSKYIDAPFFYLAHPEHICLDVHYINRYDKQEYPMGMWRGFIYKTFISDMSAQLLEEDVMIVSKNTRPMYRMDKLTYFCILPVVNIATGTLRYIEYNFNLLYRKSWYDINRKLVNGNGEVTKKIETIYNANENDHICIITNNRTKDAYIKLSNRVKKEVPKPYCQPVPYYQFSYDYATDTEIQKVKEIINICK